MPDTKVHSRRGGRYFRIRIRTPKVKLLPDSFSAEMVKTHCVVANRLVLDRTAAIPILLIIDCLYWIRTSVVEPEPAVAGLFSWSQSR